MQKDIKITLAILFFSLHAMAGAYFDQINAGNIQISGDQILTTDTNGNLTLQMNGTGSILLPNLTASTVPYLDSSKKLQSSSVTPTELGYVHGVTSAIQTQLTAVANAITALTGDATASGPGSVALTLATVNSNTGSFGSSTAIPNFTVNGKGLLTAAGTNAVVAPAGTLSGTTLNSSVVTSSLTSIGTIGTGTWQGTKVGLAYGGTNVDLSSSGGTSQVLFINGSHVISAARPACSDLSNSVSSCSTDTTNASNISSGTLGAARLPNPSATTLGGVESLSAVSHNFLTSISTSGVPAQAQPACGDLSNAATSCSTDTTNASNISSGTLGAARLPNPSSTTLGGIESLAAVSHNFLTSISTSGVPAQAQPACGDLSNSAASCSTDATNASNISSGTLAIARGGTNVSSVTVSPTASAFAGWDANKNLSANNHIPGSQSIATAAGTTALVVGSPFQNIFTGSSTQTVTMPVVSGLVVGQQYQIINLSSGVVTVQSSGANTIQAMAQNTQLLLNCISTSGTGTASWTWTYQAVQNSLSSGGTVTSVTFTGDGTVLSSTPSSAVTTSGTLTAALATQAKNTVLAGPSSGSNAAPTFRALANADLSPGYLVPTIQKFMSTGTQTGWVFTVTSANATVGAVYTNNSNSYTVQGTISAGTTLFMSGTGATSGSTLTKSSGTGDSTITFSAKTATATYTAPSSPAPSYIRIRGCAGGGGGAGSGTTQNSGTAGGNSYFGANVISLTGGSGATGGANAGGAGGAASIGSLSGIALPGGAGQGKFYDNTSLIYPPGGAGGASALFGGAGAGASGAAGGSAVANSGSGGAGGGLAGVSGGEADGGGGAGGCADAIMTSGFTGGIPYVIGGAGTHGNAGTNGFAAGDGAAGLLEITEMNQ